MPCPAAQLGVERFDDVEVVGAGLDRDGLAGEVLRRGDLVVVGGGHEDDRGVVVGLGAEGLQALGGEVDAAGDDVAAAGFEAPAGGR